METLGKLRRRHLIKGENISAIARDTQLSRNTVHKYVAAEIGEPRYVRKQQPFPQLGPFRELLMAWLETESQRPVRELRTAKRLFEALQGEGYGGYDSVRRFVQRWKKAQRPAVTQAFVPLAFAPGAKYQFDWSHKVVELGGILQTVKVAHFRLCYSRRPFVAAYPRETQEMVFDAHNRAFAAWGGVPLAGLYDDPKTLVDAILVGKERRFNRRLLALMNHYLIEPIACTPAAGWEKGQVENQVGTLREWLFTPRLKFASFEDLNAWLIRRCQDFEQRPHPEHKDRTIGQLFEEERAVLWPFTAAFDGYVEHTLRVSSTCLVNYDRNRYSVPAAYAGKAVSLRAYAGHIQIIADAEILAEHPRCFGRGQSCFNPWHDLPVLERKPRALLDGAPFQQWALPEAIRQVQAQLMKQSGGDKAFVELLLAGRQHGLDPLEVACALEQGTVTAAVVLNHLHRLLSPRPPEPLSIPERLRLTLEPTADCARYDRLRPLALLAEQDRQPTLPQHWLKRLIEAEQTERQVRTLRYQLSVACFPMHRDLASFDFAESPLSEPHLRQLATAAFTVTAHNWRSSYSGWATGAVLQRCGSGQSIGEGKAARQSRITGPPLDPSRRGDPG